MWEEIINGIKQKIEKKDFDFTAEEKVIVKNSTKLQRLLIKNTDKSSLVNNSSLRKIVSSVLAINSTENNLEIDEKEFQDILYECLKGILLSGSYMTDFVNQIMFIFQQGEDFRERLKQLEKEAFEDPNNKFELTRLTADFISLAMHFKRYDLLKREVGEFEIIDSDQYHQLKEKCPNFQELPIVKKYQMEHGILNVSENTDILELLEYFYVLEKTRVGFELIGKAEIERALSNKKKEVKNLIISALKKLPDCNFLTDNDNLDTFFCDKILDMKEQIEIANLLYEKDCLDYSFYIQSDNKREKLNECIKKHKKIKPLSLEMDFLFNHDNDELMKLLLDYGYVDYIIEKDQENPEKHILEKYTPYILSKIKENDPNYQSLLQTLTGELLRYPEIANAIIEQKQLKNLRLKGEYYIGKYREIILKAISLNPKITIIRNPNTLAPLALLKLLQQNKCYETIFKNKIIGSKEITNYTGWIIEIADDIVIANFIISEHFDTIKLYPEIINALFKNPILAGRLLKKINEYMPIEEDEDTHYLDILYNEENFEAIKPYLIKEYKLNAEHLERLEKVIGPILMKDIGKENIHKIINLDEETFDKILKLFPVSEYTKKDLEAAYDSLIQYLYHMKHPEDITLKNDFVEAIEKKDYKTLHRLKEKIITYTRQDFFKNLKTVYNQDPNMTLEELLDEIIKNYDSPKGKIYKDMLYVLTKEFIANARDDFRKNHCISKIFPEKANMLEKLLRSIDTNDYDTEKKLTEEIYKYLDNKFYKINNISKENFQVLKFVIEKIKDPNSRNEYLPVLRSIIDYYYSKVKEKHKKELCLEDELETPYTLDDNSTENELIKEIIINSDKVYNEEHQSIQSAIIKLLHGKVKKQLVIDCLNYANPLKRDSLQNDETLIQQNLKIVRETAIKYIRSRLTQLYDDVENPLELDEIIEELDEKHKIKRNYQINSSTINICPILERLDIDRLKQGLLNDEIIYNRLVDIMKKKKLHLLPENLKALLKECNISRDHSNIANLINFLATILEREEKRIEGANKKREDALSSLDSILSNAETYSTISNVYSQILGEEDSKLIALNPGPYEAVKKTDKEERLREAVELTLGLYKRLEITVPTFELETEQNGKKLLAVVGNFTNPCNLTHGERTGACMRIGGIGESLFYFCLQNKNGFHIRLEDPETHEYMSRISCFRNGKNVFFNGIRHSLNKKAYSDEDLILASQQVARELIERTKDSKCPIRNVFVSDREAMEKSNLKKYQLGKKSQTGMPTFYCDIDQEAILLATDATVFNYAPLEFGIRNLPVYETLRTKPRVLRSQKEIVEKINRIYSIMKLLEGEKLESIPEQNPETIYAIATDDWYIYVDEKRIIHYNCIDIDPRAKMELSEHLERTKQMFHSKNEDIKSEGSYGV